MNLHERLEVLESMTWEIRTCQDMNEYLSYGLHDTPYQANGNEGLYFIFRSLMALQILILSKFLKADGAFSFQKIINIAGATVKEFNIKPFQNELNSIIGDYKKNNLDTVRDKFIAHLDLNADETKTDIHSLNSITNQVVDLYSEISKSLGSDEYVHDDRCLKGFKEIFDELDKYEMVKGVILAAQIQQKKKIDITDFIKLKC